MLTYIILLVASVGFGIPLGGKNCKKWEKIVYCAAFALIFTFISAVRFQVGYDYLPYAEAYFDMKYFNLEDLSKHIMEKGFLLPLYILHDSFKDYWVIFVYTSIIIYFSVFGLIYKYSECPWISVCAFLCFGAFFNSLCFLRQFIAAIIVTYAVKFIHKNNYPMFLIFILAAATFHWSALAMAVLYFFLRIKPSWIYFGIIAACTILFCIFSRPAIKFFSEKFYMYQIYDPEKNPEAFSGLSPRYTIIFGLLFLICFLFRKKLIEEN